MPSLIDAEIAGSGGVKLTENYLRVRQSPGAALAGIVENGAAPLLTFSTPNLRLYKVTITGGALDTDPELSNSQWSKVVRALQVTSELFAVFAPSATQFCYMAPDFNTNPGVTEGNAVVGTKTYSIVEQAIADATGIAVANVSVVPAALTGLTVA